MGNICIGGCICCNLSRRSVSRQKSNDKPFSNQSPVFRNERSGYHLSLAKVDSAPSSCVVGINAGSGLDVHHHFIANSEASLLKIHHSLDSASRKSFVSRIPPLGRSGSSETKYGSDAKMNALFEKYRDLEQPEDVRALSHTAVKEDLILAFGTEALCRDLEMKPDDFRVLLLAWKCSAEQMCRFTRQQFLQGCRALKADNIRTLQTRLSESVTEVMSHMELFKSLYRFTYRFGLASSFMNDSVSRALPSLRNLPLDMAIVLWQLVFSQCKPPILKRWLNFLTTHQPAKGISGDTWDLFLPLSQSVEADMSGYDDSEAWPSLFDDFAECENDETNQNYEVNKLYSKPLSPNSNNFDDDVASGSLYHAEMKPFGLTEKCNESTPESEPLMDGKMAI